MDVTLEISDGCVFKMQVPFYSTVLEMKKKIQDYYGFPLFQQTLVFQGQLLKDEAFIKQSGVLHDSRILLQNPNPYFPQTQPDFAWSDLLQDPSDDAEESAQETHMGLRMASLSPLCILRSFISLPYPREESKLHHAFNRKSIQGLAPFSPPVLHNFFPETPTPRDNKEGSNPNPASNESAQGASSSTQESPSSAAFPKAGKRLTVMLMPVDGSKAVPVEVRERDRVRSLRGVLVRLVEERRMNVPEEYFFIHGQRVMEEERSFLWHGVRERDTIDVFPGTVCDPVP